MEIRKLILNLLGVHALIRVMTTEKNNENEIDCNFHSRMAWNSYNRILIIINRKYILVYLDESH